MRLTLRNFALTLPLFFGINVSYSQEINTQLPTGVTLQKIPFRFMLKPDEKCSAENQALQKQQNSNEDIHLRNDANLTVMFHGNRYVIAKAIVQAYENAHPGVKISYTTLPPANAVGILVPVMLENRVKDGTQEVKDIAPDVVMLPTEIGNTLTPSLANKGIYSNVHGIVMLSKKGALTDKSIAGVVHSDLRFVLPGKNPTLSIFTVLESRIGAEEFQRVLVSRTGVSNLKHHRYVPLRIAAGCEDVGFQYLQAVKELERLYPKIFDYTPIPTSADDFANEASSVYTVASSIHSEEAERFADFMKSEVAQRILRQFDLQKD